MAKSDPQESTYEATVTHVSGVKDGSAVIRYRDGLGVERRSLACVGGWGDARAGYWPPAVGDVVSVEVRPVILLKRRPRGRDDD